MFATLVIWKHCDQLGVKPHASLICRNEAPPWKSLRFVTAHFMNIGDYVKFHKVGLGQQLLGIWHFVNCNWEQMSSLVPLSYATGFTIFLLFSVYIHTVLVNDWKSNFIIPLLLYTSTVATFPVVLHWLCDSPRTGCAQITKMYMRGASNSKRLRRMISIVACCHSVKLCTHAAWAFLVATIPGFIKVF